MNTVTLRYSKVDEGLANPHCTGYERITLLTIEYKLDLRDSAPPLDAGARK